MDAVLVSLYTIFYSLERRLGTLDAVGEDSPIIDPIN
jgi:hypothetical protein